MTNVTELGPHERMTVEQVLECVKREKPRNVMVIYDDEEGYFYSRNSQMSKPEALFMVMKIQKSIMMTEEEIRNNE